MNCANRFGLKASIFLLVTAYALCVGILVQKVIVPYMGGENGLLPVLDTVTFHEMAIEMSDRMDSEGWSAWEWNPGWSANQPVGIMAAVYYFVGPDPIYLLPINALFHGLSAVVLLALFQVLGWGARASVAGILPFVFFPSTLTWVSQFHKDGLYCLGLFSMFLGCAKILSAASWRSRIGGIVWIVLGAFWAGLMRGYGVTVFAIAAFLVGAFLIGVSFLSARKRTLRECANSLVFILGILAILPFAGTKGGNVSSGSNDADEVTESSETVVVASVEEEPAPVTIAEVERPSYLPPETPWQESSWLPGPVDRNVHRLVHNRTVFFWLFPDSGTFVDKDQEFRRAEDVLFYLPRALVIGLFSPFPDIWLGDGQTETGGAQRRVAAVETVIAYVLLAGCLYGLIRWPSREKFFVVLVSILLIVALVYPVPAVGSLYRLRFGAFSLLLGMGAISLFQAFTLWRLKRQ
tara:strand:- start:3091 stop:4482 length:1392 start_codon:yes stop_codon:yes gene_type:complete